jgi:hypothetical protein
MSAIAPTFLHQKSSNLKCRYKKALRETFLRKSRALNDGEIDTCTFEKLKKKFDIFVFRWD